MKVSYYITGHGYGHATRVIGQVQSLILKGIHVDIITSLSSDFIISNLKKLIDSSYLNLLSYHQRTLDASAVQDSPLSVNVLSSLEGYYNNIHVNRDSLLEQEVFYLKSNKIDLVIIDATLLPLTAASLAGIPSVIVSNFTWDFTYEQFYAIEKSINENIDDKYELMISKCIEDSCNASYYILLPGDTPLPTGFSGKVIDGPMICRQALTSKEETRQLYNIPIDSYIAVLGFGGFKMSNDWVINDSNLPDNWYCFVLAADNDPMPSNRFIPLNRDVYVPDIINASDAVIGKLGYGTVSECLRHGTPLIYVPRADWPEEPYLEKFILKYNAGIKLSVNDFLNGKWSDSLSLALNKRNSWDISNLRPNNAFDEITNTLIDIIKRVI